MRNAHCARGICSTSSASPRPITTCMDTVATVYVTENCSAAQNRASFHMRV